MASQKQQDPFAGLEFEELRVPRTEIQGFLVRPHKDNTKPVKFVGVLRDEVTYKDDRGKDQTLFMFESMTDQPEAFYTDSESEQRHPIQKGTMVGISASGAIKALVGKKNHVAILEYTGKKIPTKNGDMWEINAKVSKTPLPFPPEGDAPFS